MELEKTLKLKGRKFQTARKAKYYKMHTEDGLSYAKIAQLEGLACREVVGYHIKSYIQYMKGLEEQDAERNV